MKAWLSAVVTVLVWLVSGGALAQSGGGGEGVQYVPLSPAFVTNYGAGEGAPPRFVKAEVSVRVATPEAAEAVKYHGPALRNYLLMLLTAQTEQTIGTVQGREGLRKLAMEGVNKILKKEEGKEVQVQDLLFTSFVVQQ